MEKESAVEMIARCAARSDGPKYADLSAEQWAQVTPKAPPEPFRPMANESLGGSRELTTTLRKRGRATGHGGSSTARLSAAGRDNLPLRRKGRWL